MNLIFSTTLENAQTMQSNLDALNHIKIIIATYFSLGLVIGISNLLWYLMIKHSPDQSLKFLIPKLNLASKNVFFEIENDLGRPLNYTRLTIFKDEKIFKTLYFKHNSYSIKLPPGSYSATVSKFGYTDVVTKVFKVDSRKNKFNLTLHKSEEIKESRKLYQFSRYLFIANLLLTLVSIMILVRYYTSTSPAIQIMILAIFFSCASLLFRYREINRAVRLVNFKDQPLKYKDVQITNHLGENIQELETDNKGLLYVMLAPGLYKITPEDKNHRIIRVNETGLGHLKIKF